MRHSEKCLEVIGDGIFYCVANLLSASGYGYAR
jgi:hypothetical protein